MPCAGSLSGDDSQIRGRVSEVSNKVRVAVSGVLASGLLLLLYFTVVSFAESSTHAV